MAKEPKKYREKEIMEIFKKKSYPYKVSILKECLKNVLENPVYKTEVFYIAEVLGYELFGDSEEPRWIEKLPEL